MDKVKIDLLKVKYVVNILAVCIYLEVKNVFLQALDVFVII